MDRAARSCRRSGHYRSSVPKSLAQRKSLAPQAASLWKRVRHQAAAYSMEALHRWRQRRTLPCWEQSLQAGLARWPDLACSRQVRLLARSRKRRAPALRLAISVRLKATLPPMAVQPGQSLTSNRPMPEPAAASMFLLSPVAMAKRRAILRLRAAHITREDAKLILGSRENGHRPHESSGRDDSRPTAAGGLPQTRAGRKYSDAAARRHSRIIRCGAAGPARHRAIAGIWTGRPW